MRLGRCIICNKLAELYLEECGECREARADDQYY